MPVVLFNQFKYFFNLFFLLIALSQIIPALRVGFLISFVAPLVFVLAVTMLKEFYDDRARYMKDTEINKTPYMELNLKGGVLKKCASSNIRVGDLIVLNPNERAPADMVLLWTSDPSGSLFIRTDQLDGETDWKVRRPLTSTQTHIGTVTNPMQPFSNMHRVQDFQQAVLYCDQPNKNIYDFLGLYEREDLTTKNKAVEPISLEHTMWANTVLASSHIVLGLVVYTGR